MMTLQPSLLNQRRRAILSCLRYRGTPPAKAVAAIFLGVVLFAGQPLFAAKPQTDPAKQAPAEAPAKPVEQEAQAPAAAEYSTSVVCQGCHEDIYNAFMKRNAHRIVETDKKRGWEEKSCESCHGMGSKHAESASAEDILNPSKMKPSAADRICLTCHLNTQTQVGRVMGGHARSQVACVECHSVHKPAPKSSVVAGTNLLPGSTQTKVSARVDKQTGNCVRCHTNTWGEFMRPYRHNLPEGSMTCTDCHNPHGATNRSMWQNTSLREPGCFKCHGDKRGPFTFEHAPMRLEGCVQCHQPHGSQNPRMMTRAEVRFQCMECHTNFARPQGGEAPSNALGGIPPAFHDLRSPRYRNCTLCHIKIHGSYVNRDFTR